MIARYILLQIIRSNNVDGADSFAVILFLWIYEREIDIYEYRSI